MVEIIASQEIWMYILYKQPRPPVVVGALAALAPKMQDLQSCAERYNPSQK
jgi:hypothetical protein